MTKIQKKYFFYVWCCVFFILLVIFLTSELFQKRDIEFRIAGNAIGEKCIGSWVCTELEPCNTKGLSYQECIDENNCDDLTNKPLTVQSCKYNAKCDDGIMNGNEKGIDCGGSCEKNCATIVPKIKSSIKINLTEKILADISDTHDLEVEINNTGEEDLTGIKIGIARWGGKPVKVKTLPSGKTSKQKIRLNLPNRTYENLIEVQVFYKNTLVTKKRIRMELNVPAYAAKINQDSENGIVSLIILFDNRENQEKNIELSYTVLKDGKIYVNTTTKKINIEKNTTYSSVEIIKNGYLPVGEYSIKSIFLENGTELGQYEESLFIEDIWVSSEMKTYIIIFIITLLLIILIFYIKIIREYEK